MAISFAIRKVMGKKLIVTFKLCILFVNGGNVLKQ